MIGLNIQFNTAAPPLGQATATLIQYYGTGIGFPTGTANPPIWSVAVAPTEANVMYACSGINTATATGQYLAWRYLWEVTPSAIPSSGSLLATGVWIAYMRADGTTNAGGVSTAPNTGTSNFVADQNCIPLNPDDMSGGHVIDSNLNPYTPLSGQTQTIPDGKVNFNDLVYFVNAYIDYYKYHIYNPLADLNADGRINFNDLTLFMQNYVQYYYSLCQTPCSTVSISFTQNPTNLNTFNLAASVSGSYPTGTITWTANSSTGTFSSSQTELNYGTATTTYSDSTLGPVTISAAYSGDTTNEPTQGSCILNITGTPTQIPKLSVVVAGSVQSSFIPAAPIGTTFSVDVRLDNVDTVNSGVSGYSFGLNWNPTVLNCTSLTYGSLLANDSYGDQIQLLNLPPVIYGGSLLAGGIASNGGSIGTFNGPGVLATATFQVISQGESSISLCPSSEGIAYLTGCDSSGNFNGIQASTSNAIYGASSAPLITVNFAPTSIQVNQEVTCTAKIFGNNPTGQITWSSSSCTGVFSMQQTDINSDCLSSTVYSDSTPGIAVITASYGGDSNNNASSGSSLLFVTGYTVTLVVCSSYSTPVDSPVTCTAYVNGSNLTGTITWLTNSPTGNFSNNQTALTMGSSTTTYSDASAGNATIIAFYSGDSNNVPSKATATLTITPLPYTITMTHVGSGTITPSDGQISTSTSLTLLAAPAHNYAFMCWLQNGTFLSSSNPYIYTPTNNYVITAIFYDPSDKIQTTVTSVNCSSSQISLNSPVTCTATVLGDNPTGTVTWSISNGAGYFSSSVTPVISGISTTSYIGTNSGQVTITATYSGDTSNEPSIGNYGLTVLSPPPVPQLSVVLSGTQSTSIVPTQAVGSTFSVDIRVDNTAAISEGINGYCYNLTWDPTVLNCTYVQDPGPFLNSGANLVKVLSVDIGPDNSKGIFAPADIIVNTLNMSASAYGSGVLTTVTFQVLTAGQSGINLFPIEVGVPYLVYPDSNGESHDIAATTANAMYGTKPISSEVETVSLASGAAQTNDSSTGVAVSLTGSSAQDDTNVTIASTSFGSSFDTSSNLGAGANYYDVQVTSDASLGAGAFASISFTNPDYTPQSVISYLNGGTWTTISTTFVAPDTLVGSFPVSDLGGTPIKVSLQSDFSLSNVQFQSTVVQSGFNLPINITVQNKGTSTETAPIQLFANSTLIYNGTVTLNAGSSMTLNCSMVNETLPVGNYTVTAYVPPSSGQTTTNTLSSATVAVTYLGDLNGDLKVNFNDILTFVSGYIAYYQTGTYTPAIDYNHDGLINFNDITLFVSDYIAYYVYGGPEDV